MSKVQYYDMSRLLATGARWLICYGERSNGKTFQSLLYALKTYLKSGAKVGIIRRYREDFKGKRGGAYWDNLCYDGEGKNHVKELTKGKFDTITYYAGKWYLAYYDDENNKYVTEPEPFAYAFSLTEMEHEKGNTYPIGTLIFDEFMSRTGYLADEFISFMNTVSTCVRSRAEINGQMIRIIMCANTVSKYCPYWEEFGIEQKIRTMKKGDLAIINFGDSGLKMAVEYCDSPNNNKPSDVFFAFDNPKLKMITGGEWEIDIYPHLTTKFDRKDIKFSYFIIFKEYILQADIVIMSNKAFTFIHKKTTPIKDEDKDIIFKCDAYENINYLGRLTKPTTKAGRKILSFFVNNKVFYSTNEVGEIMDQYMIWSEGISK